MAHLAVNGGWQTTFVLVNTDRAPGSATLSFYDDNGNPLPLPLTFPQGTIPAQQGLRAHPDHPGERLVVGAKHRDLRSPFANGIGATGDHGRDQRIRDFPLQHKRTGSGGAAGIAQRELIS